MALNYISAILLFAITLVLGYTLFHLLFGRWFRQRREAAFARLNEEKANKPDSDDNRKEAGKKPYSPSINGAMGYEFIRVIHPEITALDVCGKAKNEKPSYADSAGVGAFENGTVSTGSRDESIINLGEDDGYHVNRPPSVQQEDEPHSGSISVEEFEDTPIIEMEYPDMGYFDIVGENPQFLDDERQRVSEAWERAQNMPDLYEEYLEEHKDEMEAPEKIFEVPADEQYMTDYQRGVVEMEDSIGKDQITMEDLRKSMGSSETNNGEEE